MPRNFPYRPFLAPENCTKFSNLTVLSDLVKEMSELLKLIRLIDRPIALILFQRRKECLLFMTTDVFRKTSLERLSSPEQLDRLLTVTSPRSWLALCAMGLLIAAALIWSIFGSLSTKVNAQGILMKSGGIHQIVSTSGGQITDVRVRANEMVSKGQAIARVAQPELIEQLDGALSQLAALQQAGAEPIRIAELKKNIELLRNKLETSSRVVSPYSGRVLEVKVAAGDYVTPGKPIISLEPAGAQIKDLEAIFYVAAEQSKEITPGMDVSIAPTSVNKQEYGLLLGRVTSVAEYPSTPQAMLKTLGNEDLVQKLGWTGTPVEIVVDIVPDDKTPSGYKWTTPNGPPLKLESGTLAQGSITVKTQRPLALLFPQFN